MEPDGTWRWWLMMIGRGGGKTRTGSQASIKRARTPDLIGGAMLICGRTAADTRDVLVEGESGILNCSPPDFRPLYEPSKLRLTWPVFDCYGQFSSYGGCVANLRSGDQPDGVRGLQWGWAWLDEFAHWRYAERALDECIEPAGRLGADPRGLITTSPKPRAVLRRLVKDPRVVVRRGSTYDNQANLPASTIAALRARYDGTRTGRQEINGELLEDNPAALWTYDQIARTRVDAAPQLERIAVAVDPATTHGEDSDEHGIHVGGRGVDGHGYRLRDRSMRGKPDEWARVAVGEFNFWNANVLVLEDNQGGDMAEAVIRTIAPDIPIKRVHAKHGKRVRAEPIAMLDEQGRIHSVGTGMSELETQMATVDLDGDELDDRIDAYVHCFTELMLDGGGSGDPLAALRAMAG